MCISSVPYRKSIRGLQCSEYDAQETLRRRQETLKCETQFVHHLPAKKRPNSLNTAIAHSSACTQLVHILRHPQDRLAASNTRYTTLTSLAVHGPLKDTTSGSCASSVPQKQRIFFINIYAALGELLQQLDPRAAALCASVQQ